MKTMIRTGLAALALSVASPPLLGQSALPPDSVIHAILRDRVAADDAVGIVVGLLDERGRRFVSRGLSKKEGKPLDSRTVFEIGSITKVFTGLALADMAGRGEVRLDDPVGRHLPPTVRVPTRGGREITLADLATHSSGLPRLPSNMAPSSPANPYADYTEQQLYDFLGGHELRRDIGAQYEYSNLGVGLLGHVLARVARTSYEDLVVRRIAGPLKMPDTRITLSPSMRSRAASGHDANGDSTSMWDLPTLAGAGGLRSTAEDMLSFLGAQLDPPAPLADAIRLTHARRFEAPQQRLGIGLGWHIIKPGDADIIWHNGGTGGFHSFVGFSPSRRVAVVVLTNSTRNIDDIGFHLLDARMPLQKPPAARTEVALDSTVLDRYVGEYELAPTFRIAVTREGNALFGQATGQPRFRLFAESETKFFLKVVDAQITFEREPGGRVTGLILHQNGGNVPGKKMR